MVYSNGPSIVRDGLVLHLDAADRNSYPGSGSTWYDLSGNNNHATLVTTPTIIQDNKGGISFNDTTDYGTFNSYIILNDFTIESVSSCKYAYSALFGNGSNIYYEYLRLDCAPDGGRVIFIVGNGTQASFAGATDNLFNFCDTIKHFIIRRQGSNLSLYINNELLSTKSVSTNAFNINRLCRGNNNYGNQDLFFARIYNKALSSEEISQNFEATKGRFGL